MIEFEDITPGTLQGDLHAIRYQRWLATMTRAQVIAYADVKMMPRDFMLRNWRKARKALRK